MANVYLTDGRALIQHEGGLRREVVTVPLRRSRARNAPRFTKAAGEDLLKNPALPPPGVYLSFSDANAAAAEDRRAGWPCWSIA